MKLNFLLINICILFYPPVSEPVDKTYWYTSIEENKKKEESSNQIKKLNEIYKTENWVWETTKTIFK